MSLLLCILIFADPLKKLIVHIPAPPYKGMIRIENPNPVSVTGSIEPRSDSNRIIYDELKTLHLGPYETRLIDTNGWIDLDVSHCYVYAERPVFVGMLYSRDDGNMEPVFVDSLDFTSTSWLISNLQTTEDGFQGLVLLSPSGSRNELQLELIDTYRGSLVRTNRLVTGKEVVYLRDLFDVECGETYFLRIQAQKKIGVLGLTGAVADGRSALFANPVRSLLPSSVDTVGELALHEELWRRFEGRYHYTVDIRLGLPTPLGARIRVQHGRVTSAIDLRTSLEVELDRARNIITVSEAFDLTRSLLFQDADDLEIRFDADRGFITELFIDRDSSVDGDEHFLSFSNLRAM